MLVDVPHDLELGGPNVLASRFVGWASLGSSWLASRPGTWAGNREGHRRWSSIFVYTVYKNF
jgi:hypothetical protein